MTLKPIANRSRNLLCRNRKSISASSRHSIRSCSNSRKRLLANWAESKIASFNLFNQDCTASSSSEPTPLTIVSPDRTDSINELSDSGIDATLRKVGQAPWRSNSIRSFLSCSICSGTPCSHTESDGGVTENHWASDRKSARWSSQVAANAFDQAVVSELCAVTVCSSAISLFRRGKASKADFKFAFCFESVSICISMRR